ncbi:MAG: hypothetical protein ABH824_01545 [Nanoarchaeota archaeon]|nr:hypothetical protein [Nanoarchaeota archaeon]MBU1632542.1 hypothetical protein [Nanoarchaeota archaeon]MBU1875686.1 hypothetical protein [Nanoarchaeota archaeon]
MKHIGTCLDNIQIALFHMPKNLISDEDVAKATKIVNEIEAYAITLEKLVTNPKLHVYLNNLENTFIEMIKLQAHEIEKLLKDLKHMLQLLELYVQQLREMINDKHEKWSSKAQDLIMTIDQMFGGERGELRDEFKIALYKEHELKEIVDSEKHLAEFLK